MTIQTTYDLHRVIEAEIAKLSEDNRVWWMRFTATSAMSMRRQQLRVAIEWVRDDYFRVGLNYSTTNEIFVVIVSQTTDEGALDWEACKTIPEAATGIITLLRKHWLTEVAA